MQPCVLQLGRIGDILNIFPLVKWLNKISRPNLVIAREFANLAESISYADFKLYDGPFEHYYHAEGLIRQNNWGKIIPAQIYGHGVKIPPSTESFCIESYKRAGYLGEFHCGNFDKIEIDRRYPEAEAELHNRLEKKTRPKILVNFVSRSSPFADDSLIPALQEMTGAEVTDLRHIYAKRFTDLLGLYDISDLLITADTATLHLAGAHNIPYIALICNSPSSWHGSYTRGNCIMRCRYNSYQGFRDTILKVCSGEFKRNNTRQFLHVYSEYNGHDWNTRRRIMLAKNTWQTTYRMGNWLGRPILDSNVRTFQCENRKLPYVKDVIDAGMIQGMNALMVVTNTDTCFSPALTDRLSGSELVIGRRRDFRYLIDPLTVPEITTGIDYCGSDLFMFPTYWWLQRRDEYPDMLLGAEGWDGVLREMMLRDGAGIAYDLVYHERHASRWEQPHNRYRLPSQQHNLRLAKQKLNSMGINPTTLGIL